MEILKTLGVLWCGYIIGLILLFVFGMKKPEYKYFKNAEGKTQRINKIFLQLAIPAVIGLLAGGILFIAVLANYGKFSW